MGNGWGLGMTGSETIHQTYVVMGSLLQQKLRGRTVAGRPFWMVMAWTREGVGGKWSDSGHILKRSREGILDHWMWDVREMTARFWPEQSEWSIQHLLKLMCFYSVWRKKNFRFYYNEMSVRRLPRFNPWNLSSTTLSNNFNFDVTLYTIFFYSVEKKQWPEFSSSYDFNVNHNFLYSNRLVFMIFLAY